MPDLRRTTMESPVYRRNSVPRGRQGVAARPQKALQTRAEENPGRGCTYALLLMLAVLVLLCLPLLPGV
jgi:hypothetical protein